MELRHHMSKRESEIWNRTRHGPEFGYSMRVIQRRLCDFGDQDHNHNGTVPSDIDQVVVSYSLR
jgi:hypothetical protein